MGKPVPLARSGWALSLRKEAQATQSDAATGLVMGWMEQDSPKGLNIRQPRAEREARRPGTRAETRKNPKGVQHKGAILYGIECDKKYVWD